MKLEKLNTENVEKYVGYNILFKTRDNYLVKKIISIAKSKKSIKIDHLDLNNNLNINRNIYVIIESYG